MTVRRPHLWCLIGLLVILGQTVLPGLHYAFGHREHAAVAQVVTDRDLVVQVGDHHEDVCPLCSFLQAVGQHALVSDPPQGDILVVMPGDRLGLRAPQSCEQSPQIVATARGPPLG